MRPGVYGRERAEGERPTSRPSQIEILPPVSGVVLELTAEEADALLLVIEDWRISQRGAFPDMDAVAAFRRAYAALLKARKGEQIAEPVFAYGERGE